MVFALNRDYRFINDLTDGQLLRDCLEKDPARGGSNLENFFGLITSGSSGLAPTYSPSPAINFAWCSSKLSEMKMRKISPRTTFLNSDASILRRNLSKASHSFCSKPMLAENLLDDLFDLSHRSAENSRNRRKVEGRKRAEALMFDFRCQMFD